MSRLSSAATAVQTQELLEVERLVLVDAHGQAVAFFGTDAGGAPVFQLLDRAGQPRLALGVAGDGSPRVTLAGADGVQRAVIAECGGYVAVTLCDAAGTPRVGLSIGSDGDSAVWLGEADGARATLELGPGGTPSLEIRAPDEGVVFEAPGGRRP
jgi:hypothetical protein